MQNKNMTLNFIQMTQSCEKKLKDTEWIFNGHMIQSFTVIEYLKTDLKLEFKERNFILDRDLNPAL